MPSDIRSFFGGPAASDSQGGASSQDKRTPKSIQPSKPKGRGKRKIVDDSDDEAEVQDVKKSTPQKVALKKQARQRSPAGDVTTTSNYFAANGKSKPTRSSPKRREAKVEPKTSENTTRVASAKTTPKKNAAAVKDAPTSGRTSSRKKAKPSYAELDDDDDDAPILKEDKDSGDDVFRADYKSGGKGYNDEYESDGEDEDAVRLVSNATPRSKHTSADQRKKAAVAEDEDLETESLAPKTKERTKTDQPINGQKASRARKRKSADLEDDDDQHGEGHTSKKATKANGAKTKSPSKKPTPKKAKKEDVPESKEMQDIFSSIPTIRAPTPPARDENKKFDFRYNQNTRSQAAPIAGSKEIPEGAENCLAGLTFVFTGVLDSLGREEGTEIVKRYGGKVTGGPSKKTDYVVLGNDAGPKKLESIAQHRIKTINEDGLFALIRKLPANGGSSKAAEQFAEKQRKDEQKIKDMAAEMEKEEKRNGGSSGGRGSTTTLKSAKSSDKKKSSEVDSRLWTVKYAPTDTNMICGNKPQVEKLRNWLRAFPKNASTKFKKPGKDASGIYRAVIIHGPPGIGKTTAAHLAAKLEGYDIVESNASDTRSKKLVESGLKGVLDTTSLLGYFSGDGKMVDAEKKKLVLIMDEVDGMSAGDRGGVGALATVCKKTNIPMILICNDRKLPKMKPFDPVTYDLPFKRPTADMIKGRIMTICYREGLKIPSNVISALIEGSRADIRQVINMISTAKLDQEAMDYDGGKKMSNAWEKHVILKPWDIVQKILAGGMFASSSKHSLDDKIQLYFNDHEFSSLMLQENYLGTNPILSNNYIGKEKTLKVLELADNAAESISDGDLVDRMIHGSQQQWSLMPTHAVFSFVRPASFISGTTAGYGGSVRFTSWLGNNSKYNKLSRFVKEIQGHMRLRASGDRHEVRQQYMPLLWRKLVEALETNGKDSVEDVIELMDSYYLTKEDWDAISELGVGPMDSEKLKIETQTKGAFTRTYNQMSHPLPFMKASSVVAPKKINRDKPDLDEVLGESDDMDEFFDEPLQDSSEEELDLKKDKYVRAPKKKPAAPAKGKKGKATVKKEDDDVVESDGESEVEQKPKKAKGRPKTKAKK